MKEVTLFYLQGCPYCQQAFRAIRELKEENKDYKDIIIQEVEESTNPDIVSQYDYYYVPAMFIGRDKLYEAHPGESYQECKKHVREVFDAAVR